MAEQQGSRAETGPDIGQDTGARTGPVRIVDVALAAGVSVATVSKSLNGRPDVSAETRERVRAVAERLNFRPNTQARSLSTGRSFAVGLLTTDIYGRFSLPLLLGAEDEFGDGDLAVIFSDTRGDPQREARQLQSLVNRQVDGIIVNGRRIELRPALPDTGGIPVVYALTGSSDPRDCSVVPDEAGGAVLAVSHLLETGRRRVAHVTGPRRHKSASVRAEATRSHLNDHGLSVRGRTRFGAWTEIWGRAATEQLLETAPDVDAVFCGSDQIALGVLDTLRETGRRVPDDVAVVGFDNWTVMAESSRPPLTSVDLDIERIGRLAARHLVNAIEGGEPPRRTVVTPRLVLRESG
ncbi:MAG: LacI family DNA-binding transcriptional regulator [Nocardioidaceae bacterium]